MQTETWLGVKTQDNAAGALFIDSVHCI